MEKSWKFVFEFLWDPCYVVIVTEQSYLSGTRIDRYSHGIAQISLHMGESFQD